jgi:cytidyltransferase-like protein
MNSEEYHKVIELIENTKDTYNPRQGDELGHIFYLLDTYILREHYANLIKYEHRIYNEFKNHVTLDEYISGRCYFLQSAIDGIQNVNEIGLQYLKEYVQNRDYGTLGIFAGSFNPFHIGHKNVLEQAIKTFDKVIVVQMQSFDKPSNKSELPDLGVQVIVSNKLLSEVVQEYKSIYRSCSVIRALRNGDDLQHEQNLKQTVHDFDKEVNFVYYLADVEFQHISSSLVRSLPEDLKKKYVLGE